MVVSIKDAEFLQLAPPQESIVILWTADLSNKEVIVETFGSDEDLAGLFQISFSQDNIPELESLKNKSCEIVADGEMNKFIRFIN